MRASAARSLPSAIRDAASSSGLDVRGACLIVTLSTLAGLGLVVAGADAALVVLLALPASIPIVLIARRWTLPFAFFGAFLAALYAGSRDFAHLGIPVGGNTLFISEICLALAALLVAPRLAGRRWIGWNGICPAPLAIYFALGALALVRGLPGFGLEAVRHSALCYYAAAFPLAVLLTPSARHVRALIAVCVLGWALSAGVVAYLYAAGDGTYLPLHDVVRYGAGSQAVASISSVGAAVVACFPGVRGRLRVALASLGIVQAAVGLLLIQHRSLAISMLLATLILIHFCAPRRMPVLLPVIWALPVLLVLPVVLPSEIDRLPPLARQTVERLKSIATPEDDANSHWRLSVWRQASTYGLAHPILGAGFGPPLTADLGYRVDYDVDPHNSYVAMFFRLGIPGLVAFGWLWFAILRRAYARCRIDPEARPTIGLALAAHLGAAVFAFFNVALEGPYMGIPFWVSMALVLQASRPGGSAAAEPQERPAEAH
jgi:O-antigen ligase